MNTKDALQMLKEYLSQYDENDFLIHPKFLDEVIACLSNELKGSEASFLKQMVTQLNHIKSFGRSIYQIDGNEILSHIGNDSQGKPWDIYSIHISSKKYNMRFLVKFDENITPYLLCAFYERTRKQKTDYTKYIDISKNRFLQLQAKEDIIWVPKLSQQN